MANEKKKSKFSLTKMKHGFRDLIAGKPMSPEEQTAYKKAYMKARIKRAAARGHREGSQGRFEGVGKHMQGAGRLAHALFIEDPFSTPRTKRTPSRSHKPRKSKSTTIKVNGHTITISSEKAKKKKKQHRETRAPFDFWM